MICLKNISQLLTLESSFKKDGRNLLPEDLSIVDCGCVIYDKDKIHWVGKTEDLPKELQIKKTIDLNGYCLTPELVDSHTHLVFGGNRANEYMMRLDGADYQAIAQAGGGILASQSGTNNLSEDELFEESCLKVEKLYSQGVGTIEIKSGYGLAIDAERKVTKVINRLKDKYQGKVNIFNTFMAAHAVPKKFNSSNEYMLKVVMPLFEELANDKAIDAVDIFHEQGYFEEEDVKLLFDKANELGISKKIHADEFNDNNGTSIAVEYNCLSCDHLLKSSSSSINKLSQSKTVACLLPGTAFFLGKDQVNAKSFLDAGVKVAIASDYNPGSCHCDNLLLLASLAAPHYKMNSAQLWSSITLNAAAALGLYNQGSITVGSKPRFTLFKTNTISEITYNWGNNLVDRTIELL